MRKVDDNIGLLWEKCRLGHDWELAVVGGVKVNAADNGAVVTLCNNGADDMTHFAVGACNGHIYHILNIPFAYTARAASSRPVLLCLLLDDACVPESGSQLFLLSVFHFIKGQTAGACIDFHHIEGFLYGNGVNVDEESICKLQ